MISGAAAQADTTTYDWTFTGSDSVSGSGTFTVDTTDTSSSDGFTGYLITDATGTIDGQTITGVITPYKPSDGNNNLLGNVSLTNTVISGSAALFDNGDTYDGVALATATDSTYGFTFYSEGPDYYLAGIDNSGSPFVNANGPFSVTEVPEPTTLALAGLSALGTSLLPRRRK